MRSEYSVPLKKIVEDFNLEPVFMAPSYEQIMISSLDVNRPGLQLAGFYDYFDPIRIQVIGKVENTYLSNLTSDQRCESFSNLMSRKIPALIICHGLEAYPECAAMAKNWNISVFRTSMDTSELMAKLIMSLNMYLARRQTVHGVLVEVHGEGMLIMGESGIGKSETALELIKRGHRLIADDAVEIKRTSSSSLIGSAPDMIKDYMEVRGIGVVNIRQIFGIGSIKPSQYIDMVVQLEAWDNDKVYDRLGVETEYKTILGVKRPCVTIPVRPGRNLAVIMELAAMNNRQKKLGYNAALSLVESHDQMIDSN